ncbi:MAG TPA: carbon starvation CstA family protein [Candidatus Bathyarchaeia archaeon]|nr:carbon starvation CstA family protein [Candidatus Bathyarchaeia archaeon]
MYESLIVMLSGIIIYGLVYQFYVKWFDKNVIQSDPARPTPSHTYMDGVEFFPSNKYVMLGWHWKSIAALGPVTGPALAIVWGWLPGLLWILIGNALLGWLHDYNAIVTSVRSEGASLGPLTYQLVGARARKVLVAFLGFYTILLFAAFLGALLPVIVARNATTGAFAFGGPAALVSFMIIAVIGVLSGVAIFKAKINVIAVTAISLLLVAATVYLIHIVLAPTINAGFAAAFPDPNMLADVVLLTMLVFSFLGAVLPLWSFAMPINYLGFYVAYFVIAAILGSAMVVPQTFQAPMITSFFAPLTLGAGQGVFLFSFPLWPLMFVTIACGACSGWHGLIGSSLSAKQLDNESDAHLVGGGSMLLEGILGLTSVVAVASLKIDFTQPIAALGLYVNGGAQYLLRLGMNLPYAIGLMSLMVLILGLTLTQLACRFARLAISEMAGVRAFKNIYITSIVASIVTYLLVSPRVIAAGLWGFIWALFGGSNQLLAGVTLLVTTLWLTKMKKPNLFTGIPAVFMIVTTIFALGYTAYATLFIAVTRTGVLSYGSGVAGVIAVILTILGIVLGYDGLKAYGAIKTGGAPSGRSMRFPGAAAVATVAPDPNINPP